MKFRFPAPALVATLTLSVSLALLAQQPAPPQTAKPGTVFVTHAGKYYHREKCRYWDLAKTKTPLPLKEAKKRGYAPCRVCRPNPR
jgi:competence protein ComEC